MYLNMYQYPCISMCIPIDGTMYPSLKITKTFFFLRKLGGLLGTCTYMYPSMYICFYVHIYIYLSMLYIRVHMHIY